jgi:hypothetical protein
MSSKTASARPGHDRASRYDEITGKIIAEFEGDRVPWVQPWGTATAKAPLAMPKNAATGRQYSGINVLILSGAVIAHGFPGQSWLTFRQALLVGGNVRKVSAARPSSMPIRPGIAVHQRGIHQGAARARRADQHGRARALPRQYLRRAALVDGKA